MDKKGFYFLFALLIPPVVTFLVLFVTKDAITCLVIQTITFYLLCKLYDSVFGLFKWNWYLGKDKQQLKNHFGRGLIFFIFGFLVSSIFFLLYSYLIPIETASITIPLPILSLSGTSFIADIWLKLIDIFYILVFGLFYGIVVPIMEEGFYRVFQFVHFRSFFYDTLVSIFYGIYVYSALFWVIEDYWAQLYWSVLAFVMSMGLVIFRNSDGHYF